MAVVNMDVKHMETAALNAAKAEKWKEANQLVADVRTSQPDADPYDAINQSEDLRTKFRGLMGDAQIFAAELESREQSDDMRGFMEKHKPDQRLAKMFDRGEQPGADDDGAPERERMMSPGQKFVTSEGYQKRLKSGEFNHQPNSGNISEFGVQLGYGSTFPVHRKALSRMGAQERAGLFDHLDRLEKALLVGGASATGGGAFTVPQYDMDWEPSARAGLDILDLLPIQRTTSDTIYWIRQDTRSSAATTVSQATTLTGTEGTKPESALSWSRQQTPVQTIAVWLPVTNQQLSDVPEIRGVIDGELTYDIELELDKQILQGNGTAPNLSGILTAGIQALTYSSATYDNLADAILRGVVNIMTADEPDPTGIVINPVQWYVYSTMKTSGSGEYLAGPPSASSGPRTMWGLPLVVSNRMPNQKALVGNFMMARLHMREDANVKVGFVNDDFINNRIRILAELRAALTVRRPNAFCQITSLPTS